MIKVIGVVESHFHRVARCRECNVVFSYHPVDVKSRVVDCRPWRHVTCPCCGADIKVD